jgi:HemK-like putative methylase
LRSENPLQGRAVWATEEGRKRLLKILQFYDLAAGREARRSLSTEDPQCVAVAKVLEQLERGVPPQYILGRALFMGHTFYCTSDTLVPRPETSLLVQTACAYIERKQQKGSRSQTVLEIGTGCGNIAVSLAMLCGEDVRIMASDISTAAVEVARRNVGSTSWRAGYLYSAAISTNLFAITGEARIWFSATRPTSRRRP